MPDCAIERPNDGVLEEQTLEAIRAVQTVEGPLLPETYRWIQRMDRDLGLWGGPDE